MISSIISGSRGTTWKTGNIIFLFKIKLMHLKAYMILHCLKFKKHVIINFIYNISYTNFNLSPFIWNKIYSTHFHFNMILYIPKMEGCFWSCSEGLKWRLRVPTNCTFQSADCWASGNHRHDNGVKTCLYS
jgi:hypothetical protein